VPAVRRSEARTCYRPPSDGAGGRLTSGRCEPQPSKLHSVSDAIEAPRPAGHNRAWRSPQR
jgi:hypothetical protein